MTSPRYLSGRDDEEGVDTDGALIERSLRGRADAFVERG
jgi:hypothetical protein